MPTYAAKSVIITNAEASPRTMSATQLGRGVQRVAYAGFAASTVAALTAGQTFGLFRIPANARLVSFHPTIVTTGTTGSWKFGLARTNDKGGTVIGSALLASAVDLSLALLVDLTEHKQGRGLGAITLDNRGRALNDLFSTEFGTAGATSDAEVDLYGEVVTVSGTTTLATGFELTYVVD